MPQATEKVTVEARTDASFLLSRKFFDEMRAPDGEVRRAYAALAELLDDLSIDCLVTKQKAVAIPDRRGEYGKPILDRIINRYTSLADAPNAR